MGKLKSKEDVIFDFLRKNPSSSSKEIYDHVAKDVASFSTLQRVLRNLVKKGYLISTGNIKSTLYQISVEYQIIQEIDADKYFKQEIDGRDARKSYNHDLIKNVLNKIEIFNSGELERLNKLQEEHRNKISELSKGEYKKALGTFTVDLSWKSSQIEGNTYSLLETERLLNEKETAAGKTKDEAVMLLNHKEAVEFLIEEPELISLSLKKIEELHSILVKELGVDKNIRRRIVSITGTNYRPLDNEFQIKEAMEEMCGLVNLRTNVFDKALLILLLISYIQPFMDGNKRTARIMANAILWGRGYCPISFRTVSPLDYKKAVLIFYEQNNISAFKKIFIEQFEFAVKTYF